VPFYLVDVVKSLMVLALIVPPVAAIHLHHRRDRRRLRGSAGLAALETSA
jgi:hypothetical protein